MLATAADTGSDNRSIEHICGFQVGPAGPLAFVLRFPATRARALAENDAHPDSLHWDQPGGTATGRHNGETQRGDKPTWNPTWKLNGHLVTY